jgi:hypothetical protein
MSKRAVVVVLVGGLLFTGWWIFGRQSPPEIAAPASSSSPSAIASSLPSTATSPAASTAPATPAPDTELPSSAPLPASEQRQVERFAARFMSAFARPSAKVNPSTWWKRVAAMLTDDAVDDYLGVDPSLVPFTRVTGAAHLVPSDRDSDAAWVQEVTVPTDAGTYRVWVQLVTPGLSDRLLVAEIEEP